MAETEEGSAFYDYDNGQNEFKNGLESLLNDDVQQSIEEVFNELSEDMKTYDNMCEAYHADQSDVVYDKLLTLARVSQTCDNEKNEYQMLLQKRRKKPTDVARINTLSKKLEKHPEIYRQIELNHNNLYNQVNRYHQLYNSLQEMNNTLVNKIMNFRSCYCDDRGFGSFFRRLNDFELKLSVKIVPRIKTQKMKESQLDGLVESCRVQNKSLFVFDSS